MREVVPDFLGQDLMRASLSVGSLEPFDVPAAVLNSNADTLDKLNAYRAITFGLAGLAIRGWEDQIIRKNEFLTYGHQFVAYRANWRFNPVNLSDMEKGRIPTPDHHLLDTVGVIAMSQLQKEMQETAQSYMSSYKGDHTVGGIDAYAIVERHHRHAVEAAQSGLMDEVVAYRQSPYISDFFTERLLFKPAGTHMNKNETNVWAHGRAIAATAGNLIRFTREPIQKMMLRFAPKTLSILPEGVTEEHIPLMTRNVFRDSVRASQRIDGISTRALEGGWDYVDIKIDKKSEPYLTWPTRNIQPPRELYAGNQAPTSGPVFQPRVYRQKCPIGYTAKAGEVMPGHRLVDGIMQYMHDNLLFLPYVYFQPPKKYGSVDEIYNQFLSDSANQSAK